ncbi:MAG: PaaI family thioesterase [Chloroflexi bacterium]|nr:PaaI family thioesterase [Chloroflexota bacterium]
MIEDINARLHALVDTLTFETATVATAALQALSNQQTHHQSPFTRLLGLSFAVEDGRAVTTLEVRPHLLNQLGIAHGGVPYALVDTACGMAAILRLGEGGRVVTQDLHYRYHGPARLGLIRAEADIIHHGSRTMVVQGRVYQEQTLIGSATATFAILSSTEVEKLS